MTVCEEYAVSHKMVFNHKKSVILICRSKYMKNVYPVFTLNQSPATFFVEGPDGMS